MPFSLWGSLGSFFQTSGAPITGQHWDRSQGISLNNSVLWVDTATPSAGYNVANSATYSIYATAQTRLGDQEDAVLIATTTMVFPFLTGSGNSNSAANAFLFTQSSPGVYSGGVGYWRAGTVANTYDYVFQALTETVGNVTDPANSAIALNGSPIVIASGLSSLANYQVASTSSGFVLAFATAASGSTRNVYLQGFNTAGGATGSRVTVATAIPNGRAFGITSFGSQYFFFSEDNTGATAKAVIQTFDPVTGALGTASSIDTGLADLLSMDLRFNSLGGSYGIVEGTTSGGAHVLQFAYFDSNGVAVGPGASFAITSTSSIFHQEQVLPNGDLAIAYADNNVVHLRIVGSGGFEIGTDFIVGGITSFDRIRSLGDGRIELDYRVSSGDPLGYIFDTRTAGATITGTSANDFLAGTTFDDTFVGTVGNDRYAGGPGLRDTISYAGLATPGIVATLVDSTGTVAKGGANGTDTLASDMDGIIGSAGNDIFNSDASFTIDGGAGTDRLNETALGVSLVYGTNFTNIESVYLTGGTNSVNASADTVAISLYGGTGADTLTGGTGGDYLDGGLGADALYGGLGSDEIVWDAADNPANILGGGGTDTLLVINGVAPTSFNLTAHEFEGAVVRTTNNAAYALRVDTYNANWQLLQQDTTNLDGSSLSTLLDPTNVQSYSQVNTYNNTAGQTFLQSVLFDNNSAQTNTFDPTNVQTWTQAVTYYDTQLRTTLNSVAYDDNTSRSTYYDPGSVQSWTSADTFYNTAGSTTLQSVANDNGSSQVQYWDTTNTQNWSTAILYYNASGQLTLTTGVYDVGGTFSF